MGDERRGKGREWEGSRASALPPKLFSAYAPDWRYLIHDRVVPDDRRRCNIWLDSGYHCRADVISAVIDAALEIQGNFHGHIRRYSKGFRSSRHKYDMKAFLRICELAYTVGHRLFTANDLMLS